MDEIAVIMAAGLGERMRPLTENIPKPLIKVGGVPMIETVIEGLHRRGVEDIYIVTGYLNECFNGLLERYSGLKLVINNEYATKNNISSIYAICDVLGESDTFICEADLFVRDPDVFSTQLNSSCYFGKMVEGYSTDWVFDIDSKGIITRIGKGGSDCYNMVGISYFKRSDARLLKAAIIETYEKTGHEHLFWDEVVDMNLNKLNLYIHPINEGQIVEIDTCEELRDVEEWLKNES